jgi:hypothetical protein
MQQIRDDEGIERDGDFFSLFAPPLSIGSPLTHKRERLIVVVQANGQIRYRSDDVEQKAVLCPISTSMPVKLAEWHRMYGFVAKAMVEYKGMEVGGLVVLLKATGYHGGRMRRSERRDVDFDFTKSVEEDQEELAVLVHSTYSTLNLFVSLGRQCRSSRSRPCCFSLACDILSLPMEE